MTSEELFGRVGQVVSDRASQCKVQVQMEHANVARDEAAGIFRTEHNQEAVCLFNDVAIGRPSQTRFFSNL